MLRTDRTHLMNPVNRQYVEMASLVGQRGLISIQGGSAGCGTAIFQGVATGVHSASGHVTLFWTSMGCRTADQLDA